MSAARFTTRSANTASNCSTGGRQKPRPIYNADECRERWRGVRSLTEHHHCDDLLFTPIKPTGVGVIDTCLTV